MADMLRKPEKQKVLSLSSVAVLEETVDWVKEVCDVHICEKTGRNPARKALLSSGKRNVGRRSRWKERFAAANMGFLLLNVIFTINFIYTMNSCSPIPIRRRDGMILLLKLSLDGGITWLPEHQLFIANTYSAKFFSLISFHPDIPS